MGGAAAGQVRGQPPLESAGLVLSRADERLELVLGQRGTHRPKLSVQVRGAHLPPGVACPPLAGGVGELAEPRRALPLHGGVAVGDGRARGPLRVPIVCLDEQLIRAALPQAVRLREDAVPHVEERLRVGNQRGERGGRQALQHGTAALAVRTQHRARAAAVSAVAAAPRQMEAVRAARERGGLGRGLVYLWPHVPVTGARRCVRVEGWVVGVRGVSGGCRRLAYSQWVSVTAVRVEGEPSIVAQRAVACRGGEKRGRSSASL